MSFCNSEIYSLCSIFGVFSLFLKCFNLPKKSVAPLSCWRSNMVQWSIRCNERGCWNIITCHYIICNTLNIIRNKNIGKVQNRGRGSSCSMFCFHLYGLSASISAVLKSCSVEPSPLSIKKVVENVAYRSILSSYIKVLFHLYWFSAQHSVLSLSTWITHWRS